MKFSDDEIKNPALGIKIFIATNIRIINHISFVYIIFRKKVSHFFAKKFADKKKGCIFALAIEKVAHVISHCGNSSVGRAQPCQGWGREFESRFPLQVQKF